MSKIFHHHWQVQKKFKIHQLGKPQISLEIPQEGLLHQPRIIFNSQAHKLIKRVLVSMYTRRPKEAFRGPKLKILMLLNKSQPKTKGKLMIRIKLKSNKI